MPLPTRLPLVIASEPVTTAVAGVTYVYTVETGLEAQSVEITATESLTPEAAGPFTVTAPVLPVWLALEDTLDGATLVTGTPGMGDAGEHTVTLELSDVQGAVMTQSFTITVAPAEIEVSPLNLQIDEDTQLESRAEITGCRRGSHQRVDVYGRDFAITRRLDAYHGA